MKIAVIGAGIIGVTTAYELAMDGHEVTVFERRLAAAEEASFANAGVVAPGYAAPWAAPGMPSKIIRHLLKKHTPVRMNFPLSRTNMAWMWKCLRASKASTYAANRSRMQRLTEYSRQRLHRMSADLDLEYDRSEGHLILLRTERDHAMIQAGLQVMRDSGMAFSELTSEEARAIELALNPATAFHSAIHVPTDEVGNCRQFALLLKNIAVQKGVDFVFNTTVSAISPSGSGVALQLAHVDAAQTFDAAVVCAGVDATRLLRPLGLKIPMAAIHGYSISATVRESVNAPRSTVMDEHYKVAISRMGKRVRVAGLAEIGGAAEKHNQAAIQTLYKVLQDWFPAAGLMSSGVQVWKGSRPMLPDGPPVLGASGIDKVWLNLGHGASGWAMSCGSARVVADLIADRSPEVDLDGLGIQRFTA